VVCPGGGGQPGSDTGPGTGGAGGSGGGCVSGASGFDGSGSAGGAGGAGATGNVLGSQGGGGGGGFFGAAGGGGGGSAGHALGIAGGGGGGSGYLDPTTTTDGSTGPGTNTGNGSGTITYTVSPTDLAGTLVTDSTGKGPGTALADKASAIQTAVNAGQTATACAAITNYLGLVKAQTAKKLSRGDATLLTTDATNLAEALGC
jgi:hypothetical protein